MHKFPPILLSTRASGVDGCTGGSNNEGFKELLSIGNPLADRRHVVSHQELQSLAIRLTQQTHLVGGVSFFETSERPGVPQAPFYQSHRSIDKGVPLLDVRKTLDKPFLKSRMSTDGNLSTWRSHLSGLPLGYRLVHRPQPDVEIWYALQRCKEFLFSPR